MANGMQHMNGNMMCAIDVETTGLDPNLNELCQLAILPLDSHIKPIQDLLPLNLHVIPSGPEVIDPEALSVTKKTLLQIHQMGLDKNRAVDLLVDWLEALPLPMTKMGGYRCKIIPLGHNYKFDYSFIVRFMGQELYDTYFHPRARDTMGSSLFMNDCAGMWGRKVPYSKNNLAWVAKQHNVSTVGAHDALVDCKITAAVYRQMVLDNSKDLCME